ncbi:Flp pilus assembly protein [Fuerstiella marisgermanici]|uniref:Flp pilus assembly protein n=2 Tax=Fuerstiella marisgermanici TaxID=1891926 RepID=A0A1P8WGN9_9PLAN|nr:Flp pilus assembly protein [Fuerstiella marisgermanici]
MVEMAVCFPIFMLILLGIMEFGRALMVSQLLASASREGCRTAIVDGSTNSDVETKVKNHVTSMVGCLASDVTVEIVVTSIQTGNEIASLAVAEQRDLIEIDVTVPFNSISYSGGRFLNGQTIRGQCAMRKE